MTVLAVDIGNYKIAYGLFDGLDEPLETWREATGDLPLESPVSSLSTERKSRLEAICIASVVPSLTDIWAQFGEEQGLSVFVLDHSTSPLKLRYNPPADLGPDRIANAVAAKRLFGCPCCVVDMGTATTFDVVSSEGEFIGGAIAPGIETAAQSLYQKAARLTSPGLKQPSRALGQSTADCLLSGTVLGYTGLVAHLIQLLEAEIGPFVKVVGTGGMIDVITQAAGPIHEVRPHLTLQGINLAYRLQKA